MSHVRKILHHFMNALLIVDGNAVEFPVSHIIIHHHEDVYKRQEMHNAGKPHVVTDRCVGCGACRKNCAHSAISITDRKASIDHSKCVGCGRCIGVCPMDAVDSACDESNDILNLSLIHI